MSNYYDILGVELNATLVEIKRAFKEKALEYHPDRNGGDPRKEEVFKEINAAYQTLSNSYSRSNYDLLLRHGRSNAQGRPEGTRRYQRKRPPIYRPKVSSRENLRATMYAFLFACVVAILVKGTIFFVEQHRKSELAFKLAERRDVFNEVVKVKKSGNLIGSLNMIEELGRFHTEERDMRNFKDSLIFDMRDAADIHLERGEYDQAIIYFDKLSEYSIGSTLNYMRKMAEAFKGMGDYKKTLEIYQTMRMYGYKNASFFYDIGNLYELAGNAEQALNYYTQSAEMAASEYEVTIGKAYPVLITAQMIPKEHYDIYLKVSEMHLVLGQYDKAIRTSDWSKEIWSDSLKLYEIQALSFAALGQTQNKNNVLNAARLIDPDFEI